MSQSHYTRHLADKIKSPDFEDSQSSAESMKIADFSQCLVKLRPSVCQEPPGRRLAPSRRTASTCHNRAKVAGGTAE